MSVDRILYHFPLDPASRQARLAFGEKKLSFRDEPIRYWEQPKELLVLNPSGLVPVLVEIANGEKTVVCEIRAILEHLEEAYPEPSLLGTNRAEKAETRRLLQWFDRKFDYEVNALILHEKMEKRLYGLGAPELGALRAGREALKAHLGYIEHLLQDRDWLAGRRLSVADYAAAANISVIDYFGDVPWREFAQAKTWYMKVKSRPAFRPLLTDRWPGFVAAGHYDDLDF
jgi:glutathione S-transferase